jgi:hypothetical protein
MGDAAKSLATVLAYHERTKHHPGRFARSLGHMDWATQPDPFRRFAGAPVLSLDLVRFEDQPRYEPAFFLGNVPPVPLGRRSNEKIDRDRNVVHVLAAKPDEKASEGIPTVCVEMTIELKSLEVDVKFRTEALDEFLRIIASDSKLFFENYA